MLNRYNHLEPIETETESRRMRVLIADIVEDSGNYRSAWLKERHWTAVPVESADHFLDEDISRLCAALRQAGISECLAVATEPLGDTPICYKVPTTEEGLREFSQAAWAFCFILLPEDRSCAVLCTKDDYFLVGGPSNFVTMAIGTGLAEAHAKFAAFAASNPHSKMREGHCRTSSRYQGIEPEGPSVALIR